jgi:hypothetical protein
MTAWSASQALFGGHRDRRFYLLGLGLAGVAFMRKRKAKYGGCALRARNPGRAPRGVRSESVGDGVCDAAKRRFSLQLRHTVDSEINASYCYVRKRRIWHPTCMSNGGKGLRSQS